MDAAAKEIIDRNAVPTFTSDIIYKISDWLKEEVAKRKAEIPREEIIGAAKILKLSAGRKTSRLSEAGLFPEKLLREKPSKSKGGMWKSAKAKSLIFSKAKRGQRSRSRRRIRRHDRKTK